MTATRWHTFPTGTQEDAERYAADLQDRIGGTVTVGDHLAGIGAWEILVGPPARPEPVAVAAVTAYAVLDGEGGSIHAGNVEAFPATDDPDSLADVILRELGIPDGIATPSAAFPNGWRQSGGDDHGDGLTSWDYVADLADLDAVAAIMDYAGSSEPGDGTPNLGIIRGPEEGGTIPGGMTWDLNGMDWNVGGVTRIAGASVAVFPITVAAADAVFGPDWRAES